MLKIIRSSNDEQGLTAGAGGCDDHEQSENSDERLDDTPPSPLHDINKSSDSEGSQGDGQEHFKPNTDTSTNDDQDKGHCSQIPTTSTEPKSAGPERPNSDTQDKSHKNKTNPVQKPRINYALIERLCKIKAHSLTDYLDFIECIPITQDPEPRVSIAATPKGKNHCMKHTLTFAH